MKTDEVKKCVTEALHQQLTFPEYLRRLRTAGIVGYQVDIKKGTVELIDSNQKLHHVTLPDGHKHLPAENFNAAKVKEIIHTVQAGKIGYTEFLKQISHAGVSGYTVDLKKHHIVYKGKEGIYEELFP